MRGIIRRRLSNTPDVRPLAGLRALELGQLIAGPFTGTILAYFGAEVIKVEPPGKGDPIRVWRELDTDGTSPWWRSIGRNKKSVALDLKSEEGRAIVRELAAKSDVLIENFRPGTLEKWKLCPAAMEATNKELIYARLSGYGQTGPLASKPGFASVCEAFGGFRYINGFEDRPPVRPNLSMGDTLAGLHAALGVVMALLARERGRARGGAPRGEVVDVAIYESVFNLMEGIVPEYDRKGVIRKPSGSTLTGIVPTNTYMCADGKYVVIGGNGDSIYKRLMVTANRVDLANDPRLSTNPGRVTHQAEVDGAIAAWTASLPSMEVLTRLESADVPSGPIYSVEDMATDPQYEARGMLEQDDKKAKAAKYKLKSSRSATKRFKVTSTGKLLRHFAGKAHLLRKKRPQRQTKLRRVGSVNDRDLDTYQRLLLVVPKRK